MNFIDTFFEESGNFSGKQNNVKPMFSVHKKNLWFNFIIGPVMFLLVSGCGAPYRDTKPGEPSKYLSGGAVCVKDNARHEEYDGSLWKDNGFLSGLFVNQKARMAGDIVTIKIIEASNASNQASTKSSRKSGLSASIESFFNAEKRFPGVQPFFNPFSEVKGSMQSDFDGSGTTKRSGALEAYITANVTEVMANGNLKIRGSREVTVNNDDQLIALTGIIRPRDISPENIILSTYISDAKISYSGSGVINDRQRPGWMARIFDVIWPF